MKAKEAKSIGLVMLLPLGVTLMAILLPIINTVKPEFLAVVLMIIVSTACVGAPGGLVAYVMATGSLGRRKKN